MRKAGSLPLTGFPADGGGELTPIGVIPNCPRKKPESESSGGESDRSRPPLRIVAHIGGTNTVKCAGALLVSGGEDGFVRAWW